MRSESLSENVTRRMRSFIGLATSALALTACRTARPASTPSDPCARPGVEMSPFDVAQSLSLAGTYQLVMISEWEEQRGRVVKGRLELWAPDTLLQHYEPDLYQSVDSSDPHLSIVHVSDSIVGWHRSSVWRPLSGAADIDLASVGAPGSTIIHSRDPYEPGLRMEGVELRVGAPRYGFRAFDGSSTTFVVERAGPAAFSGHWRTDFGIGAIVRDGRRLPNPSGRFCAWRVPE